MSDTSWLVISWGIFFLCGAGALSLIGSCAESYEKSDKGIRQERSIRCGELCGRGSVKRFNGKVCECYGSN